MPREPTSYSADTEKLRQMHWITYQEKQVSAWDEMAEQFPKYAMAIENSHKYQCYSEKPLMWSQATLDAVRRKNSVWNDTVGLVLS